MSPNVMEMGRAGSAFLNTASSRRVRHKPCRTRKGGGDRQCGWGSRGGLPLGLRRLRGAGQTAALDTPSSQVLSTLCAVPEGERSPPFNTTRTHAGAS